MDKLVKKVFTKVEDGDNTYYSLNENLEVNIEDDQEASEFLADVIRYWHDKQGLFCHNNTWTWNKDSEGESVKKTYPEDDWTFQYKTPSDHGGCVRAQKLLDMIFGSRNRSNNLPYTKYYGDRVYVIRFDLLKAFIEGGEEEVKKVKEEEAREKAEKERKEAEEANKRRLKEVLGMTEKEVSANSYDFLLNIASRDRTDIIDLEVHGNVVVALAGRSHWSGSSGIARYSQVHVFANGISESEEWQYRHHYDSSMDNYRYSIDSIGKVDAQQEGSELTVKVELINGDRYSNLNHSFQLEIPEEGEGEYPKLSEEELTKLRQNVESERERIREHLEEMWEHKPRMLASVPGSPDGYQSYSRPKVSEATVLDTGVAYFTTEEQIDHRTRNRQMRHELYVMKPGDKKARRVVEDHAYENFERGAYVRLIDINPDEVKVETPEGKRTISLNPVEA